MTDELDRLRNAMRQATPDAHSEKKAADIARAMEIFDRGQGSGAGLRPKSDRPRFGARLRHGAEKMIHALSSRGAITASTALVALGVTFYVTIPEFPSLRMPEVQTKAQVDKSEAQALQQEEKTVVADVPAPTPEPDKLLREDSRLYRKEALMESKADFSGGALIGVAPSAAPAVGNIVANGMFKPPVTDTEAYANEEPNPLKVTAEDPVSTFSIDVDTTSWSVIRSSLNRGQMPPEDAVRIEEMVNYFPYSYPAPEVDGPPFQSTVSVTQTPWNPDTKIVHIGLQGQLPALEDRPPLNLVFLVDSSGSMVALAKLPLLKQSLRLMLDELRPEDEVAIVSYAGASGLVLEATPASDEAKILSALEQLSAGGSTAGQAGLEQAYSVAEGMAGDGEVSHVILATDGDFNVGLSDPSALEDYIAQKRESGTYLSVLGFGRGNLDDATMQALAQNGNGMAAYIDTLSEARKVLVDQLSGALFPIADDVKVQLEFNPATVAEYRLIGYETRALRREDFNNDKVDAGEIGAGHSVTALYEITPVGSNARLTDPLRYSVEVSGESDELGFIKLRYKLPGEDVSRLLETPITDAETEPGEDTRFATAIAGFGQLLNGNTLLGDWTYQDAIKLATSAKGTDPFGYRAEAVMLMRLAESHYCTLMSGNLSEVCALTRSTGHAPE